MQSINLHIIPASSIYPVIQPKNNNTLNFVATLPELAVIGFLQRPLEEYFKQEELLVCVDTSEQVQTQFNTWIAKIHPNQFTLEQLHLSTLISSLWNKTKNLVDRDLQIKQNQELTETEQASLLAIDTLEKEFIEKGESKKIFSLRQTECLVKIINIIETLNQRKTCYLPILAGATGTTGLAGATGSTGATGFGATGGTDSTIN